MEQAYLPSSPKSFTLLAPVVLVRSLRRTLRLRASTLWPQWRRVVPVIHRIFLRYLCTHSRFTREAKLALVLASAMMMLAGILAILVPYLYSELREKKSWWIASILLESLFIQLLFFCLVYLMYFVMALTSCADIKAGNLMSLPRSRLLMLGIKKRGTPLGLACVKASKATSELVPNGDSCGSDFHARSFNGYVMSEMAI